MERVAERAGKVQLSAKMDLVKPRAKIDSSSREADERIDIYANSDKKKVMNLGLEDDELCETVGKMKAVFETFASYGSGWVLQHLIQIFIKLANFSAIRKFTFFDLPFEFENPNI